MVNRRIGKVYVLALVPPAQADMLTPPADQVQRALQPGASVTRYGREWIIGKTVVDQGVLSGRIGFRGAEGVAEIWDEDERDFTSVAVPAGLTAPFAILLPRLRLAVQTRGSDIKLNGLIGAFQQLLSSAEQPWRVESPRHQMSFSEWRATVDKVTAVRFRVRKPNPHYQGTPNLEALIEAAEAQMAVLELASEDGIDTDATFLAESQAHVERGYGEAVYHGLRQGVSDVGETVYNTEYGAEEVAHEADVDEHGEVPAETLAEVLTQDAEAIETNGDGSDT